jgi:hypothetical protein
VRSSLLGPLGFGAHHAQVRLEQQTSNQGPPDERRVFDEQ